MGAVSSKYNEDLCNACKTGDIKRVQYWIDQRVDLNCAGSPLHNAVEGRHLDIVALLLEAGAEVNTTDYKYGNTPLHIAVWYGLLEIIQLLIEYNADINKVNKYEQTPLFRAA